MKILMVNPNVTAGGAQKIMLYLARGLEQRGHRVVIATTHVDLRHLPPFAKRLTYLVDEVPILRAGGELATYTAIGNPVTLAARLVRLRRGIRRVIREQAIDLVNPHNPPANWLCSFLSVPVVWSCHNNPMAFYRNVRLGYSPLWPSKDRWYHRMAEWGYEQVDRALMRRGLTSIVSLSGKIARGIEQVYGRSSEIIPFALAEDDGIAASPSSGEKFQANGRPWRLIQVGQLAADKRPGVSLDVLDRVRQTVPHATLTFVGDGPLRVSLERDVARRGLQDAVTFLGVCNEQELAEIYHDAHVLLFPGGDQPFGLVPIEAIWKMVMPVVAPTSGITEILARHGLTTVAEPSAEAFAQQVRWVYDHRLEMPPRLLELKRSLEQEISYARFLDRYEQLFERCFPTTSCRISASVS